MSPEREESFRRLSWTMAGLVAALGLALGDLPRPSWRVGVPLALLFGFTIFTNSIEGGTALLGLVTSVAFLAWGIYWLGFPQFSELGWL